MPVNSRKSLNKYLGTNKKSKLSPDPFDPSMSLSAVPSTKDLGDIR